MSGNSIDDNFEKDKSYVTSPPKRRSTWDEELDTDEQFTLASSEPTSFHIFDPCRLCSGESCTIRGWCIAIGIFEIIISLVILLTALSYVELNTSRDTSIKIINSTSVSLNSAREIVNHNPVYFAAEILLYVSVFLGLVSGIVLLVGVFILNKNVCIAHLFVALMTALTLFITSIMFIVCIYHVKVKVDDERAYNILFTSGTVALFFLSVFYCHFAACSYSIYDFIKHGCLIKDKFGEPNRLLGSGRRHLVVAIEGYRPFPYSFESEQGDHQEINQLKNKSIESEITSSERDMSENDHKKSTDPDTKKVSQDYKHRNSGQSNEFKLRPKTSHVSFQSILISGQSDEKHHKRKRSSRSIKDLEEPGELIHVHRKRTRSLRKTSQESGQSDDLHVKRKKSSRKSSRGSSSGHGKKSSRE